MDQSQKNHLLTLFRAHYLVSETKFYQGTPCWIWTAATHKKTGYGSFGWGRRSYSIQAHRASYRLHVGEIPEKLQIDHLCRVRNCVNPLHLDAVTCAENLRRGIGQKIGEFHAAKTHCPRGHEYTPENTYDIPGLPRGRQCRQCKREWDRAHYKPKKVA